MLAAQQAAKAADHAADARSMQETMRNMRVECNERWVSIWGQYFDCCSSGIYHMAAGSYLLSMQPCCDGKK